MKKLIKNKWAIGGLATLIVLATIIISQGWFPQRELLRTSLLTSPYIDRPVDPVSGSGGSGGSGYINPNTQPTNPDTTKPPISPCMVGDKAYYQAGGPDSDYCKELQSLVSTSTGKQEIFLSDATAEKAESRYTTALAILRLIKETGGNVKITDQAEDWILKFNDTTALQKASKQELSDFKSVYVSGILTGRLNPQDKSQVTLAPLDKITNIESMAMFRQAVVNSLGGKSQIKESNLPSFILTEYRSNPDWQWIAEGYSFGVDYGLISKDEYTRATLFNNATRADIVRFLAKFKVASEGTLGLK